MIFYTSFLLFKLIYPLPTIHKFIKDIELCVAEFFVFKPYFHNDRAIYFIRRTSARMTHTAVFALLPVFKRQESREYIAVFSGKLFHDLVFSVSDADCFEVLITASSAASAGMMIRDIAVFVLDGGSASDSLGFYAAVGIGSEINKAVATVSPVNVVVVIEYVRIDKQV